MESESSDAGVFGEPEVVRIQRVLFAARGWIGEEERMAQHGHALVAFHAHRLPRDRMEALVRCFERVLMHAPQAEMPGLIGSLREAGARVEDELSLVAAVAADARAAADTLGSARPFPRGFTLSELGRDAPVETIRAVQELQAAGGLVPLPGWFLRGGEGRAVTLALRDRGGALAGAATVCAVTAGSGRDTAEDVPAFTGMPICTCLREDAQGRGVSATLMSAALRAAWERFGTRWFYGIVRGGDEAALRMARRCGFVPHPREAIVMAVPSC